MNDGGIFIYKNCLWEASVTISEVVGISMQKQLMFGCLAWERFSLYGTEIESHHAPNLKVPFSNIRAG